MDEMNNLLSRYWEALNNEVSAIENSPSWSGKKDNIRFLAGEIHTAKMFIEAMEGNYAAFIAHIERAEERSQQMIQFIMSLNLKKMTGAYTKECTSTYTKECVTHGLYNCGDEPGCPCKCHNG